MLTNLLPGLRQVRAPLAAGYIWLLALWLVFERALPDRSSGDDLVTSIYRLGDLFSIIGIGVVLSFLAYLLGSLSTSLFPWEASRPMRIRSLPPAPPQQSARVRARARLNPLTSQSRGALLDIARSVRAELESLLSTLGYTVEEYLDDAGLARGMDPTNRASKVVPKARLLRRRHRQRVMGFGPGNASPTDFEAIDEERIATAIARDLDVIETTRLLGKDQELYSALDRFRAETEFRMALVPPVIAIGLVVTARVGWPWSLLSILLALALGLALFLDAVKLQRRTNDTLVQVLSDDRVQSPTVERLRNQAREMGTPLSPSERAKKASSDIALAISGTLRRLEEVQTSEPSLAADAQKHAREIAEVIARYDALLPPDVLEPAQAAARGLVQVSDAWVAAMVGEAHTIGDAEATLERAKRDYASFLGRSEAEVARLRTSDETHE